MRTPHDTKSLCPSCNAYVTGEHQAGCELLQAKGVPDEAQSALRNPTISEIFMQWQCEVVCAGWDVPRSMTLAPDMYDQLLYESVRHRQPPKGAIEAGWRFVSILPRRSFSMGSELDPMLLPAKFIRFLIHPEEVKQFTWYGPTDSMVVIRGDR